LGANLVPLVNRVASLLRVCLNNRDLRIEADI